MFLVIGFLSQFHNTRVMVNLNQPRFAIAAFHLILDVVSVFVGSSDAGDDVARHVVFFQSYVIQLQYGALS